MTIKQELKQAITSALSEAAQAGLLGNLEWENLQVVIERPRNPEHGDYACGVALKLAGLAKMAPLKIAEIIVSTLESKLANIADCQLAPPGYINFSIKPGILQQVIQSICDLGSNYGRVNLGNAKKVLIEYVSANPTGYLHIGHGRNGVFGSSLANLLRFANYDVTEEFYVNDAGVQIAKLGECAWVLYQNMLGKDVPYPQEGYPAESLKDFLEQIITQYKDSFLNLNEAEGQAKLASLAKETILQSQKELLKQLGIQFQNWFSENSLHQAKKVDLAIEELKKSALVYEAEGALWLKAKELGDERDRVLVKSNGSKTYLAPDAAYHLDKYKRGYDLLINIWGADHHGQVPSLKAVVKALGQDPNKLEIILTQIVNLSQDGQLVRMSKRMGTVVYLHDLIDEVGVDAVRYYLSESNPQNAINFDLELAKKTSRENPAFYIQYAHARCCAILRKALENVIIDANEQAPPVAPSEWTAWLNEYKNTSSIFSKLFDDPQTYECQKNLIMCLDILGEIIEEAVQARAPGNLARYAYDVANHLQKFYETCRVICEDKVVMKARLGLIIATSQVLANVLGIIGVSAPEKM